MTAPRLYLHDDARARRWSPFVLTRPVGELLHGSLLQRERASLFFGAECVGHLADPRLRGFSEGGAPPVVEADAVGDEGMRIVLSSRAVPTGGAPHLDAVSEPTVIRIGEEAVGWILPDGSPLPPELREGDGAAESDPGAPTVEVEGSVPGWPWDLVAANAERIARDIGAAHRHGDSFLLTDVHVLGDRHVSLGSGATVEPGVVVDVREGPVRLEPGARVQGPARLTGPLWIGRGSTVLGGTVAHSSIGPACKVRGEVEASVFLAYCNKAHDGYLGHAYLGRWVNLGALTTDSDLKNNYSNVRVSPEAGREMDTGLLKVGCFLGDHVKTGIGTLLNTGTVVGAGSNLFGGAMPPKHVPPFSWGAGSELSTHRLEDFLETAAAAMARRDVEMDEGTRELLSRAWEDTR